MGNIFSLEIISFDIFISPFSETKDDFWSKSLFFLVLISIFAVLGYFFIKHFRKTPAKKRWVPPPSIFATHHNSLTTSVVILCILSLIFPLADFAPNNKYSKLSNPKFSKKVVKGLGKTSASVLSTAALYFGLDALSNLFAEDPELSLFIIISFSLIAFLLIISLLLKLYNQFYHNRATSSNPLPPNTESHELNTFTCPNKRV